MSQVRLEGKYYNPNRDLAHNVTFVVRAVAEAIEKDRWPVITAYMDAHEVTEEQIGAAVEAYCKYLASCTEIRGETMEQCLRRAGWMDAPPQAQLAFMAYLGLITAGISYHGVMEATLGGEGPAATCKELAGFGKQFAELMAESKWKRLWRAFKAIFKGKGRVNGNQANTAS